MCGARKCFGFSLLKCCNTVLRGFEQGADHAACQFILNRPVIDFFFPPVTEFGRFIFKDFLI